MKGNGREIKMERYFGNEKEDYYRNSVQLSAPQANLNPPLVYWLNLNQFIISLKICKKVLLALKSIEVEKLDGLSALFLQVTFR